MKTPPAPAIIVAFQSALLAVERNAHSGGKPVKIRGACCHAHPIDLAELKDFIAQMQLTTSQRLLTEHPKSGEVACQYAGVGWRCYPDPTIPCHRPNITIRATSKP